MVDSEAQIRSRCWGMRYKSNKNWSGWKIAKTDANKENEELNIRYVRGKGDEE